MRLRPECKNGGSRPFLSWDMEIPHSIYPIIKIVGSWTVELWEPLPDDAWNKCLCSR